jgi:hypothetical protein
MFKGNYQQVHWCLWIVVSNHHAPIILVREVAWDFSLDNLAKQAALL